jgi:hypothetical protein
MGKQLLVIMSRSCLPLHQTIGKAVFIGPAVGRTARDFNGLLNPSTESFVLIAKVIPAPLCPEPFAQPVEQ